MYDMKIPHIQLNYFFVAVISIKSLPWNVKLFITTIQSPNENKNEFVPYLD